MPDTTRRRGKDEVLAADDCLRFVEDPKSQAAERHEVLALVLHAAGGDQPGLCLAADLRPAHPDHFLAALEHHQRKSGTQRPARVRDGRRCPAAANEGAPALPNLRLGQIDGALNPGSCSSATDFRGGNP
jgi:hypothetical protein